MLTAASTYTATKVIRSFEVIVLPLSNTLKKANVSE
jgi:hypothetical protein